MITAVHVSGSADLEAPECTQQCLGCTMVLPDELQAVAIQAQAAAAKQGDTVRSLKASLKDGKANKVGRNVIYIHHVSSCGYPCERRVWM